MTAFWINKYRPLALTAGGRVAALNAGEAPFVDGSHRREPYLSKKIAGITAICRGKLFAPRLNEGDVVVYLTTRGTYIGEPSPTTRLTAVLRVVKRWPSHAAAAAWFTQHGLPVPPNCIVRRGGGAPADACRPCSNEARKVAEARYRQRVRDYPAYFVCEPLWLELEDPPVISDDALQRSLGRLPVIRTPTTWRRAQVEALLEEARIPQPVIGRVGHNTQVRGRGLTGS